LFVRVLTRGLSTVFGLWAGFGNIFHANLYLCLWHIFVIIRPVFAVKSKHPVDSMVRDLNRSCINILYSGYGNIGDEMILVGTLNYLKRLGLNCVRVIDQYEQVPLKLLMTTRKELKDIYTKYTGINELLGSRVSRFLNYVQTSLGLISLSNAVFNRWMKKERGMDEDIILWHRGCSGYDSYHSTRLLATSIVSTASIASRFPVTVLGGLSMGYTDNAIDRELVKAFLRYWHFILLREPYSFRYVKTLINDKSGLYLVHDFAVHAERMPTKTSEEKKNSIRSVCDDKPAIGLILRDYYYQRRFPADTRTRYLSFIRMLVNVIEGEGYKAILIPAGYLFGRDNDVRFYTELLKTGVVNSDTVNILEKAHLLTPGEFIDMLSGLDMVVSVRTHGFIASALAGIPAIHLYYEHKGAGISKFTFGVNGLSLFNCMKHDDECIREIRRMIEDRRNISRTLPTRIQKAREYNHKLLEEVLTTM